MVSESFATQGRGLQGMGPRRWDMGRPEAREGDLA